MELRQALKNQYHLGFQMLRDCIERCPDDFWESGKHPRNFWRIAYHTIHFTHMCLQPSLGKFRKWPAHLKDVQHLWGRPPVHPAYEKSEVLLYLDFVDQGVDSDLDNLNLDSLTSGFPLFKMSKIELILLNLRHLQGHIGQLQELLMGQGVEVGWAGMD